MFKRKFFSLFSFLIFFSEKWMEVALYYKIAAKSINQVLFYPTWLQLWHVKQDSCGVPKVGGQVSFD